MIVSRRRRARGGRRERDFISSMPHHGARHAPRAAAAARSPRGRARPHVPRFPDGVPDRQPRGSLPGQLDLRPRSAREGRPHSELRELERGTWSPTPARRGLGLEYFCTEGDDLWRSPDAELFELGTAGARGDRPRPGRGGPGGIRRAGAEGLSGLRQRVPPAPRRPARLPRRASRTSRRSGATASTATTTRTTPC